MTAISDILKFIHTCQAYGYPLAWVPLSQSEIKEITSGFTDLLPSSTPLSPDSKGQIFNCEIWETADAARIRQKVISTPVLAEHFGLTTESAAPHLPPP